MKETGWEKLREAYRKGKDPRVAAEILMVHMVYICKKDMDETATDLMRSAK